MLKTGVRQMAMTEEDKKIYEELLEEYKDDKGALEIIKTRAKDRNSKMEEVKAAFELLY